jgi:hypothetical protein
VSWNHRVLRRKEGEGYTYAIHEVYYDPDGNVAACTENPVAPYGESLDELIEDVESYRRALNLPVIDYDTVGVAVASVGF